MSDDAVVCTHILRCTSCMRTLRIDAEAMDEYVRRDERAKVVREIASRMRGEMGGSAEDNWNWADLIEREFAPRETSEAISRTCPEGMSRDDSRPGGGSEEPGACCLFCGRGPVHRIFRVTPTHEVPMCARCLLPDGRSGGGGG